MDIYASFVRNIVYPFANLKNRSKELNYLKKLEKSQFFPIKEIRNMQFRKLKKLVEHAHQNCNYYKKQMDKFGIVPDDIKTLDDISKFPILSKEDIQENLDAMISSNVPVECLIKDKTGGSTGKPLIFYYDENRLASREAATIRHYRWSGWDIGKKTACVWGAVRDISKKNRNIWKYWLKNKLLKRLLLLDSSAITEDKLKEFTIQLKHFRPNIYRGYAKSMVLFAKYVKDNNINDLTPEAIITSAEVLDDYERKFIESVFNCKVFNLYGCREFAVIASECEAHEGLHINAENLLVEVIKDGKPAEKGERGEILITDLENFTMPLIRYKIGDVGILSQKSCSCGRGLPLIERIGGRVTDFIETVDDVKISGVAIATYVITNVKGVRQVQFIQENVDSVIMNIVKNNFFNSDTEKMLVQKFKDFIGTNKIRVAINYVNDIPNAASGKYRFVISKIDRKRIKE